MTNCIDPFKLYNHFFSNESNNVQKKVDRFPSSMEMEPKTVKKTVVVTAEHIELINKDFARYRNDPLSNTPNPNIDKNSNYYDFLAYIK